jgi:phosphoribosylanthranilate isomerase
MALISPLALLGINNLSDARFAAAAGFSYIGFCFNPTQSHYIAPIKAKEIMDWTTGSAVLGEFGNQSADEIAEISELLNLDAVIVNNSLLPDELKQIAKAIIKKIDVAVWNNEQVVKEINAYATVADAFLIHSSNPAINELVNGADLCKTYKIFWGLDVTPENVISVIENIRPYAIALQGGDEERPGVKDFDQLNELLEQLTAAD